MLPTCPLHLRSRRQLLLGAGALVVALPALEPGVAAGAPGSAPAEPECLADLIESGEVTRADLVAR